MLLDPGLPDGPGFDVLMELRSSNAALSRDRPHRQGGDGRQGDGARPRRQRLHDEALCFRGAPGPCESCRPVLLPANGDRARGRRPPARPHDRARSQGRPHDRAGTTRMGALLQLSMRNPNHVLSRSRILSQVWEYGFEPGSNVVDVYVSYLRRKMTRSGLQPLPDRPPGRLPPAPARIRRLTSRSELWAALGSPDAPMGRPTADPSRRDLIRPDCH